MQWNSKPEKKHHMTSSSTMASSSKLYDDDIARQWRSWEGCDVLYTKDFPAGLLLGTELSDNSLAKGATRFEWIFDVTNPRAAKFITRDNASGIENQRSLLRFCKIGNKESSSAYNQYGQGRICTLTRYMPIYEKAQWKATFKHCGNPKSLTQISHPWRSSDEMQSSMVEIPIDDTNRNLGFEWDITFDAFDLQILGEDLACDARKLFNKTKERLTTKYNKSIFDKTEFILTVKNSTQTITESSRTNKWKTFRQMLEELPTSCCKTVFDETFKWKSVNSRVTEFFLSTVPKKTEPAALVALRTAFPTFGTKCENSQRVHIINDGRNIESRPKPEMEGRTLDNHQNGEIVFVETDSTGGDFNDQPTPCTIKVSIKKKCENLLGIYKMYRDEKKRRAEEARVIAAKERAEKAARAAMEKAEKAAKEKAMLEEAAKKIAASKLTTSKLLPRKKPTVSSDDEDASVHVPVPVSRKPLAVGGGGAARQHTTAQQPTAQQPKEEEEEEEPLSPSMPVLYSIPTFTTTSHQPQQPQPQPQQLFSIIDMKEMLRMSLSLMSPENAQRHKEQVKVKYGFDDTTI
jgi:hypothetical protein